MRTRSMTLPDPTADRLSVWTVTKSRDFLVKSVGQKQQTWVRDLLVERALDEYDERLAINGYRKNHERRAQQPSFHKGLEDLVQASLVYSCS
jgi:hypothetical protein